MPETPLVVVKRGGGDSDDKRLQQMMFMQALNQALGQIGGVTREMREERVREMEFKARTGLDPRTGKPLPESELTPAQQLERKRFASEEELARSAQALTSRGQDVQQQIAAAGTQSAEAVAAAGRASAAEIQRIGAESAAGLQAGTQKFTKEVIQPFEEKMKGQELAASKSIAWMNRQAKRDELRASRLEAKKTRDLTKRGQDLDFTAKMTQVAQEGAKLSANDPKLGQYITALHSKDAPDELKDVAWTYIMNSIASSNPDMIPLMTDIMKSRDVSDPSFRRKAGELIDFYRQSRDKSLIGPGNAPPPPGTVPSYDEWMRARQQQRGQP
jgi:hypothetical protein